jgi:hypothetical protein
MATTTVKCLRSRYIADEYYGVGETYQVDAGVAERYAALGDFAIILAPGADADADADTEADAKMADPPANKMQGSAANKRRESGGWRKPSSDPDSPEFVKVDGTPA